MTAEEEKELHEMGADITGATDGRDEPLCIARAFATPAETDVILSMQGWIDLEAIRSPLLYGRLPASAEELQSDTSIFGLDVEGLAAEEMIDLGHAMIRAIEGAFAMALPMQPPDAVTDDPSAPIGAWLPIFSCLVTQCGLSPESALRMHVGRAYALIAGMRANQGWKATGTAYALRNVTERENCRATAPVAEEGSNG